MGRGRSTVPRVLLLLLMSVSGRISLSRVALVILCRASRRWTRDACRLRSTLLRLSCFLSGRTACCATVASHDILAAVPDVLRRRLLLLRLLRVHLRLWLRMLRLLVCLLLVLRRWPRCRRTLLAMLRRLTLLHRGIVRLLLLLLLLWSQVGILSMLSRLRGALSCLAMLLLRRRRLCVSARGGSGTPLRGR